MPATAAPSAEARIGVMARSMAGQKELQQQPGGSNSPEAIARRQAQQLREQLAKGKDTAELLKEARDTRTRHEVTEKDIDGQLQVLFSTENSSYDPNAPEESGRFDRAKRSFQEARRVAEVGFDQLTPTQQADMARRFVDNVVNKRSEYQGVPDDIKLSVAREILQNGTYQHVLDELSAGRLTPREANAAMARVLTDARVSLDRAETDLIKKNEEIAKNSEELRDAKDKFRAFEEDSSTGQKGQKQLRLDVLEAERPVHAAAAAKLRGELAGIIGTPREAELRIKAQDKYKGVVQERGLVGRVLSGQVITDVLAEVGIGDDNVRKMAELMQAEGRLAEHTSLRNEKTDLEKKVTDLEAKKTKFEKDKSEIENKRNNAESLLRNSKERQQEQVVAGMERLLEDAAHEYFDTEFQNRLEADVQRLDQEARDATDRDEASIKKWIGEKFYKKGKIGIFGKEGTVINKENVRKYMQKILAGNGQGMKEMLEEVLVKNSDLDPNATGLSFEEKTRRQLEKDKLQDRLNTDKDFVRQESARIAGTVMELHLSSGGKLYPGELRMLVDSTDWGTTAVDFAVRRRSETQQKVDSLLAGVGGSSYVDRMKRRFGGNWLVFLLMIMGGVALGKWFSDTSSQEGMQFPG